MNKNILVALYFGLAGLGLVLLGLVTILAPLQIDKTIQYVLTVLGLASTAAVTFYMLGKQGAVLEEVKAQTNGNLSRLQEQNADLQRQLLQAATSPTPPKK